MLAGVKGMHFSQLTAGGVEVKSASWDFTWSWTLPVMGHGRRANQKNKEARYYRLVTGCIFNAGWISADADKIYSPRCDPAAAMKWADIILCLSHALETAVHIVVAPWLRTESLLLHLTSVFSLLPGLCLWGGEMYVCYTSKWKFSTLVAINQHFFQHWSFL